MTINEAIKDIQTIQSYFEVSNGARAISLDKAIETMHKYQQIDSLVNDSTLDCQALEDRIRGILNDN